jgi:hypothetical protein
VASPGHDLDEHGLRHWIEEVHPDETCWVRQRSRNGADRQRARVRGHHAAFRDVALDVCKDLLLQLEVFGNGFDDQVNDVGARGGIDDRQVRAVAEFAPHDRRNGGARLHQRDRCACLEENLDNPDTHRPAADDESRGAHCAAALPKSSRAMITCWIWLVPS